MSAPRLPSVVYEPAGLPSLFERWEGGDDAGLPAPLAVRDPVYRTQIIVTLEGLAGVGRRLISVGAGNGYVEAQLDVAGWDVLATDAAGSALRLCKAKGLATAVFRLTEDSSLGEFDAIYCDGVMGHLWEPGLGVREAWDALAALGHAGSICLVSNDLADYDDVAQFGVRSSGDARFYRPPAGSFGRDATLTSRWSVQSERIYHYLRAGAPRRREIVVARLLMDKGVEAENGPQLGRGQGTALS